MAVGFQTFPRLVSELPSLSARPAMNRMSGLPLISTSPVSLRAFLSQHVSPRPARFPGWRQHPASNRFPSDPAHPARPDPSRPVPFPAERRHDSDSICMPSIGFSLSGRRRGPRFSHAGPGPRPGPRSRTRLLGFLSDRSGCDWALLDDL